MRKSTKNAKKIKNNKPTKRGFDLQAILFRNYITGFF